jgi:phosphatidylinositol alpha-1,6-mannosyltransferase
MKPRLLVLTPGFPPSVGGIQLLAARVTTVLAATFDVRVVALAPAAPAGDVPVRSVAAPGPHAAGVARLNAVALAEAERFRPDAVLSFHVVVAPAALAIGRRFGVPVVQYAYAMELLDRPRLTRAALRRATAVVAISTYTRELCRALGAPDERLTIIAPGVDPADAVEREPVPGRLITVARLDELYKGHDVLLRALPLVRAHVPHVHWHVVGDGRLRGYLESLAAALGVRDAVTFAGAVSDAEREAALAEASLFAMPSRLPAGRAGEGFGIAYLEAGRAGLPVVGGNAGGAVDAVRDGETGLLVDAEDHVAVAGAVTRLLSAPDEAAAMGARGREHAAQLTWQRAGDRVAALLRSLLG